MYNIRRFDNFQHTFLFTSRTEQFELFFDRFLEGDLGKIYTAVPWEGLVRTFGLGDARKGPLSIFDPQGKLALMFLKHYAGCLTRSKRTRLDRSLLLLLAKIDGELDKLEKGNGLRMPGRYHLAEGNDKKDIRTTAPDLPYR